jgi:hypothetical protein
MHPATTGKYKLSYRKRSTSNSQLQTTLLNLSSRWKDATTTRHGLHHIIYFFRLLTSFRFVLLLARAPSSMNLALRNSRMNQTLSRAKKIPATNPKTINANPLKVNANPKTHPGTDEKPTGTNKIHSNRCPENSATNKVSKIPPTNRTLPAINIK